MGSEAERSLSTLRIRKAFVSGNGFSLKRGLSTPNALVAGVDRALVAAAEEVVVLVDAGVDQVDSERSDVYANPTRAPAKSAAGAVTWGCV